MSKKQLLFFPILIAFAVIPVSADNQSITVLTDKEQYHTGEVLTVSGFIEEKKMPVIAVRMYDPDGVIISANSVEIDEFNSFSRTISLDSPFYDKSGMYLIKFDYGKTEAEITFEVFGSQADQPEVNTEKIIPEVLTLATDKPTYQDNDFITISGTVSAAGEPSVLVGIYDPFGTPTGFYFGDIGSDLKFSVSFLAKYGINFKTQGSYMVKAHYEESKREISFGFSGITEPPKENPPINNIPEKKPEIKMVPKTTSIQNTNPVALTPVIQSSNSKTVETKESVKIQEKEPEKQDNLTVEDVELGKMLNQMTLNCDNSEYVDSISYYDGMGPALMRLCKYDSAITFFDESLEENPENIEVLTNKGSALVKLGHYNEAITYYDSVLKIDPDYLPAINNKANVLAELGNFKEAISLYNLVLDHEPTYAVAQDNLEKASAKILMLNKNQKQEPASSSIIQVSEKQLETVVKVQKEEKPSSILEQIGSVFSFLGVNIFGFMK
ncbi:tetratricopeptide repeat protein [Candidatus Nitrosotenuis chungbukensis]|uniref:tetratricopeptide repeat protein n=1 Tax=Candidatus Nitrosotenuis chungbukensis TaxID=1353246 RepID=UPI0005B27D4F|nr:tetratricopeptide repeat protein [Candidatus Nitrosotenuis chungbukensis]